jgi:hypothetical protein
MDERLTAGSDGVEVVESQLASSALLALAGGYLDGFSWLFAGGGSEARSATADFGVICFAFFAEPQRRSRDDAPRRSRVAVEIGLLLVVMLRVRPRRVAAPVS